VFKEEGVRVLGVPFGDEGRGVRGIKAEKGSG